MKNEIEEIDELIKDTLLVRLTQGRATSFQNWKRSL